MLNSSLLRFSWFGVGAMCLLWTAPALAQSSTWGAQKKLTASDATPKVTSEEAYTERYTSRVNIEGGGWIGVDFTISNLGWGDGHGAVDVGIDLKGQKKYKFNAKLDRDEWTTSTSKLALNIGTTTLTAAGTNAYSIKHTRPGVSMDLTFTNTIPSWMPGQGKLGVKDGYLKYHILAPRAKVSGTVTIYGKTHKIASTRGFIDHTATNVAPFDLGLHFSRFRTYDKDLMIAWREVKLTKEHGGKTVTWLMVGYKNAIVFQDANATLRFGKTRLDKKTGYSIPFAVQVDGKSKKDTVKLILKGKKYKRVDLLARYGTAAKMVAGTVSDPFRYTFDGDYAIQMVIQGSAATLKGKGSYSIDYVNK